MNSRVLLTLTIVLPWTVLGGEHKKHACSPYYYWNPSIEICQHCLNICDTDRQCLSGHERRDKACLEECSDYFLKNILPICLSRDPPESNTTKGIHPVPSAPDSSNGSGGYWGFGCGIALGILVGVFLILPAIFFILKCCCKGYLQKVVVRLIPELADGREEFPMNGYTHVSEEGQAVGGRNNGVQPPEAQPLMEVHIDENGRVPTGVRPSDDRIETQMNGRVHDPEESERGRNGLRPPEAQYITGTCERSRGKSVVGSMIRFDCSSDTLNNNLNGVPPEHSFHAETRISAESPQPSTNRAPITTSTPIAQNERKSCAAPLASFDRTGLTGNPPHHPTEETQASSGNSANLCRNNDSQEALNLNTPDSYPILEAGDVARFREFVTTNTNPAYSRDQTDISLGYPSVTEPVSLRNHDTSNLNTSGQQPASAGAYRPDRPTETATESPEKPSDAQTPFEADGDPPPLPELSQETSVDTPLKQSEHRPK